VKYTLCLVLAIILLSQNLVYTAIGLYCHINKEYIEHQLCENRSNPQLHCNGKCYLSRQLKKAEAGESKSAMMIKEKNEQIINNISNLVFIHFPVITGFQPASFNTPLYVSDGLDYMIKPPDA
jgi:hypothetical protein